MSRRQLVLGGLATACTIAAVRAKEEEHPLDKVAAYVVPLDDCPEEMGAALAKILQADLKIRVRGGSRLPPLEIPTLPGTEQAISEELLARAAAASAAWTGPDTYRLFLTMRDINSRSANFRFSFSTHAPALNCSVVSLARLLEYDRGPPYMSERSALRQPKMAKRATAEMLLGWRRSVDPTDVMYAPLRGLEDIDRMGLEHHPRDKPAIAV